MALGDAAMSGAELLNIFLRRIPALQYMGLNMQARSFCSYRASAGGSRPFSVARAAPIGRVDLENPVGDMRQARDRTLSCGPVEPALAAL